MENLKNTTESFVQKNRVEELKKLAEEIRTLPGGDSEYVGWIIASLETGDEATARLDYENQSDKFSNKPEIELLLLEKLYKESELGFMKHRLDNLRKKFAK
ncbi:hypothetical protein C0584_02605 [Candidatus Parcubacteria bacterium]|nr:MAG: hypothetical protein C0584_02605 [Candidatus Parcubacteria bacterium]